jgi:hypothetical protein
MEIIKSDNLRHYQKLILQDFMDVEYIPLETNEEFITQGIVISVGNDILLVKNNTPNDGNIFIYDRRTGKAIRKINRKGKAVKSIPIFNVQYLTKKTMKYLSTTII